MIKEIKKTICTCDYCKEATIEADDIFQDSSTLALFLEISGWKFIRNINEMIICKSCYEEISKHIPDMLEDTVKYIGSSSKYNLEQGQKYEVVELVYINSHANENDKNNYAIYVSAPHSGWKIKLYLGEYKFM